LAKKPYFRQVLYVANMNKKNLLLLLIGFQCLILVGMFAKALYPLAVGREIRLKVVPRDPRDLLRGDYVDLSYDFTNLNYQHLPNDLDTNRTYRFGDVLYLELKPEGEFHEPAGLWQHAPAGKVCLRVTPEYAYPGNMHLKAGIESYFTDSENAKLLEQATSWSNADSLLVSVAVMLTDGGLARIRDIETRKLRRSAASLRADSLGQALRDSLSQANELQPDTLAAPADTTARQ
jgi:uncharacterized membrane-anchored protein